ncbi:molybdenum cofactor biosynthesis protein B [Aurantivibrio infirmus]
MNPTSLNLAVLTVSDTRTFENDTSGELLKTELLKRGHTLAAHEIVKDDIYQIRFKVSQWIADENVQGVLITGGTGFAKRDSTPEAVSVLFDKTVEGFGELFRQLSYQEIGNSTIQSRALAGLANKTIIFCLPGSTNACRLAWEKILADQLTSTHKPCNFVELLRS